LPRSSFRERVGERLPGKESGKGFPSYVPGREPPGGWHSLGKWPCTVSFQEFFAMPEATAPVLPRCPVCGWEDEGQLPGFCAPPGCGVELLPGTAERPGIGTFALLGHFSMCVLPFSFTESDDSPVWQRLVSGGRWQERVFSLDDPDDVERTEYFLPYIRRFLFPSLFAKEPSAGSKSSKAQRTCWHFRYDLKRLGQTASEGLPLTLRGYDARKNLSATFPLLLEEVQLIVFSYRVGFLVLRFRAPGASGATFFDQMD